MMKKLGGLDELLKKKVEIWESGNLKDAKAYSLEALADIVNEFAGKVAVLGEVYWKLVEEAKVLDVLIYLQNYVGEKSYFGEIRVRVHKGNFMYGGKEWPNDIMIPLLSYQTV